jgi:hypothetical protein
LEIKGNKVELKPVSFIDEMKSLLIKDLQREGYSGKKLQKKLMRNYQKF